MAGLAPLRRRVRRTVATLRAQPRSPDQLAAVGACLTPAQLRLFLTMQPADQQHSLEVLDRLRRSGHVEPELLQAALLHDVGKARARLRLWHRVFVDLGAAFWPGLPRWLAARGPEPVRRPLAVALCHAELGAADALRAGSSERVAALIRGDGPPELARALRAADGES